MDVAARFPAPATEGDQMRLDLTLADWGRKTLRLTYVGFVGDRAVVEGHEVRGLFLEREGRMRAGDVAPLRALLEAG